MKRFFSLASLVFTSLITYSQQSVDQPLVYQLSEKKAAEKRIAFKGNPNTYHYDVTYHKLELDIDPSKYFISGKVTTKFNALNDLDSVVFDLSNDLVVSEVTQNGNVLKFSQLNDELIIELSQILNKGEEGIVTITYSGIPPKENEAFTQATHAGTPIVWTLSEPFGAKDWWPCKQSLNDKVDMLDIYLTTPKTMVAVANGLEQSQVENTNGTKTTHFKHNYPIPAYLVAIAVTNYQLFHQTAGSKTTTFPIVNYLYPETFTSATKQLEVTLPIMNLFENLFGEYPFSKEKYGHAQFGWGGGMEHTTVSFMGGFSRGLIAHELAHHWFGNKVTCGSWKDIWINEGFSEYMSGLVVEELDGKEMFDGWKLNKINSITSQTWGNLYLYDDQEEDSDRIFNSRLTYNKGSMVVHMLRYVLTDEVFYKAMRSFLNDPKFAYNYALTTEIKSHLEKESGKDLTEFFNDWIYGEGYPSYLVNAEVKSNAQVELEISQTTSHVSVPFFEMPLSLRLTGENGKTEIIILDNTYNKQRFVVETTVGKVALVEIDPFNDIISKNNKVALSYSQVENSSVFNVYPNPVTDQLTVKIPNGSSLEKVLMFDAAGRVIKQTTSLQLDCSSLASGSYVVVVETGNASFHKKIIKN